MLRAIALVVFVLLVSTFGPGYSAAGFEIPGLTADAAAYQRDIQTRAAPQPNPVQREAALQQARAAAEQNRWPQAIQGYEQAVAAGDDRVETWLALSNAWAAGPGPNFRRALQAAWLAFQHSAEGVAEVPALIRLADLLKDKLDQPAQALQAYQEALERASASPGLAEKIEALRRDVGLVFRAVRVDPDSDPPRACLDFLTPLAPARGVRFEDYVQSEPAVRLALDASDRSLCAAGFEHGRDYQLVLREGLPGRDGAVLKRDTKIAIHVGNRKPIVGFRTEAFILPRNQSDGLPVTTVNLDELAIKVYRIGDRNLVQQLLLQRVLRPLDHWDADQIADEGGELVWQGTMAIRSELNRTVTTIFPLGQVLGQAAGAGPDAGAGQARPGIFVVRAISTDDAPLANRYQNATQWVLATDIGLTVVQGADGLTVFARSLGTAKPMAGVDLQLIARNNDVLGRVTTDGDGKARLASRLLAGIGGKAPSAVMAYGPEQDFAFLDLGSAAFDLSDRGVDGRPHPGPLDAFLYTDRGIYRPGETVHLGILSRDDAANAVDSVPLTVRVLRPNGTVYRSLVDRPGPAGGLAVPIGLADTAPLGGWSVEVLADPAAAPIGRLDFQVEDFVPERLALEVTSPEPVLSPGQPIDFDVTAHFLYGPPAAGLWGEAELSIEADPDPFPQHKGYRFGLAQETLAAKRSDLAISDTDDDGESSVTVDLGDLPDTSLPLRATVSVAIAEPGGRPTRRSLSLPVMAHETAIGIRPRFECCAVDDGREAGFDIIAVDGRGQRIAAPDLKLELFREIVEYRRVLADGRMRYQASTRDERLYGGSVSPGIEQPAEFVRRADFGQYRLEVFDPKSGAATSVRFRAGWQIGVADAATPDRVDVAADKAGYRPGETARIHIQGPFAGELQVMVATDKVLESRSLPIPAEGITLDVPVSEAWGAGAYVTATIFRSREPPAPAQPPGAQPPGAQATGSRGLEPAPVRAVGLAWLQLDPAPRTLAVTLGTPDLVRPRQTLAVPVRVTAEMPVDEAYLTIAAVDEGILQLTDFATPDPLAYYFGKRRLGLDIRDDYGRLIDPATGELGAIRQGGDGGPGGRGLPVVPVRIVALFEGPVRLDAKGEASVPITLPDFNGRVRLMAVAFDRGRVGKADRAMVVRDPVVAELTLPRFLAPGDEAKANLSLDNVEGAAGRFTATLVGTGGVAIGAVASVADDFATGQRRSFLLDIKGERAGIGKVALTVEGPGGVRLVREWDITIRPGQPVQTSFAATTLAPGATLDAGARQVDGMLPGTTGLQLSLASGPRFDVPGLLRALDRWAYGCLEQVVSRSLPLLAVKDPATAFGPTAAQGLTIATRIDEGIQRVLDKQRFDGAFGLWSARGEPELWLSAYAVEFLARARAAGYAVPDAAFAAAVKYLREEAADTESTGAPALARRAYALYALSLAGAPRPGAVRYFHDTFLDRLPTPLARAQIGAALARQGDIARAQRAFEAALASLARDPWLVDYGSVVRDAAAIIVLMQEAKLLPQRIGELVDRLPAREIGPGQTSTQEQAWLVMAGQALSSNRPVAVTVNGQPRNAADVLYLAPSFEELSRGLSIRNASAEPVWLGTTTSGVPSQPLPAARNGFRIARLFFDRSGVALDLDKVRQNDVFVVVLEGEAQTKIPHQVLVSHLLPAGWEIETAAIGNDDGAGFDWLRDITETEAVEARDDRYAAAFQLKADAPKFRLAYLVRAVTPGRFELPGAVMEDMYKPRFFARQAVGRITVLSAN